MRMRTPQVKANADGDDAPPDSLMSALYAFLFPKHAQKGKVYPFIGFRGRPVAATDHRIVR
jgi:hypothetical protein